jgi:hypothetical protein
MEEFTGRLGTDIGIERPVAEKSVAVIFDFLLKEGPAEKVQACQLV